MPARPRPYRSLRLLLALPALLLATAVSYAGEEALDVLLLRDIYTVQGGTRDFRRAEEYLSPLAERFSERIRVYPAGLFEAKEEEGRIPAYDAVVLWDLPYRIDKKGYPRPGPKAIVPEAMLEELIDWVRAGGLLVVGPIGGIGEYPMRQYLTTTSTAYGYADTPLAELLPVTIEVERKKRKFTPKEGAETLSIPSAAFFGPDEGAEAEPPTVYTWPVGEGRIAYVPTFPPERLSVATRRSLSLYMEEILRALAQMPASTAEEIAARDAKFMEVYAVPEPEDRRPPAWVADEYPFMAWTTIGHMAQQSVAKYYEELGFNRVSWYSGWAIDRWPDQIRKNMEHCAYYSLWGYPNVGVLHIGPLMKNLKATDMDPKEYLAIDNKGNPVNPDHKPCLFSEPVLEEAKKILQDFARFYVEADKSLDVIRGYIMDDEQFWVYPVNPGASTIGDFNQACEAYYKKKTGHNAQPRPEFHAPGYVFPAGSEWLSWAHMFHQKGFVPYSEKVREWLREIDEGAEAAYFAGGFWGGVDFIIDENYLQMWKEDVTQAALRADIGFARHNDLAGDETPYWAEIFLTKSAGVMSGNRGTALDPEQLWLTAGMAFSHGLRGLVLWEPVYVWNFHDFDQKPLDSTVRRLGDFLEVFGPTLRKMKRPQQPVWYLGHWMHSNSFDIQHYIWKDPEGKVELNPEWPWYISHVDNVAWSACKLAQLPVQGVLESQLMSDAIFDCEAVILPSPQYCRQEILDQLQAFMEKGGKVYVDESAAVVPEGATVLPCRFDPWYHAVTRGERVKGRLPQQDRVSLQRLHSYIRTAANTIRKEVTRSLETDFSLKDPFHECVYSTLENGDATYLFVLNHNFYEPQQTTLSIHRDFGALYDFAAGERIEPERVKNKKTGAESARLDVPLEGGGWKIFVLAPEPVAGLTIESAAVADGALALKATARTEKGVFRAAVPLRIDIVAENREATLYRATDEGTAELSIPLGDYLQGVRSVTVTELLGGHDATETF